jgi:hypothetical protein
MYLPVTVNQQIAIRPHALCYRNLVPGLQRDGFGRLVPET